MSIHKFQKEIDEILKDYEKPYWHPLSQFTRLTEEVGELGRLLNHLYGDKPKKDSESVQELEQELGDIIFAVICIANREGVNLDDSIKAAINKLQTRDKDRFRKKNQDLE